MCARVAIDLKLFNLIADSKEPISSAELATKTGAEEQLLGMSTKPWQANFTDYPSARILRGITLAGLVSEVGEQIYKANATTYHVKIPSVQAGMIHL
jgi:hypothetical protein